MGRQGAGTGRDRTGRLALPDLGLVLALIVLAALFFPESDDCYFVYWQYDSLADLFLTRPVTDGAQIVGVPQNGRYLGNLIGVLLAKCYGTPLFFLRAAYYAGGLLLLGLGLARVGNSVTLLCTALWLWTSVRRAGNSPTHRKIFAKFDLNGKRGCQTGRKQVK